MNRTSSWGDSDEWRLEHASKCIIRLLMWKGFELVRESLDADNAEYRSLRGSAAPEDHV